MTTFHVVAAAGDTAEELRSLGTFEAPSAGQALEACLAHLDLDPVADVESQLLDIDPVAELLRTEQLQLRQALAEPDVSFIVVPTEAEAHLVRDFDGEIRDAAEVEHKKACMRRHFRIDMV